MKEKRKPKTEFETKLLQKLEKWLTSYDRVFLIPVENGTARAFVSAILCAAPEKTGQRRRLVLSAAPVTVDTVFTYRQISMEEEEQLLRLYHMYEFSEHFSLIATESTYGGLFHLVETGLLSVEEAAQAMFMER